MNFVSSIEISASLLGLNPSIEKDIRNIEQGTTACLLMTHSPKSLKKISDFAYLDEFNATLLENRNVITHYEYLEFDQSTKNLIKYKVYIRPLSLKKEDAEKAIKLCEEYSLISLARYLLYLEENFNQNSSILAEQIKENIIFTNRITKNSIIEMINRLFSYSLIKFFELLNLEKKLQNYLLNFSNKTSKEIHDFLYTNKEFDENLKNYLIQKKDYPLLCKLSENFYYYYPLLNNLIELDQNSEEIQYKKTELEVFLDISKQILIYLIDFLDSNFLKENSNPSFNTIFQFLNSHPSLQSEELWPNVKEFLNLIHNLIDICEGFNLIRSELVIEETIKTFIKKLEFKFDFYHLTLENFSIPKILENVYKQNKEKFFYTFIDKLKKNPEIIVYKSKTNVQLENYYIIYKFNIPKCFINNKNQRNFIHLVLKNSGYLNGIYDFLIEPSKIYSGTIPEILKNEQKNLRLAIQEWEKQKQKKLKKSIFQIFLDWIKKIFGFSTKKETIEETPDIQKNIQKSEPKVIKRKKNIPKEKLKTIPEKIEKAIQFIERQHDGLIWIDELSYVLNFKDTEQLSSILYYDKQQKYEEVKPLKSIKYLFIRKDNLYNLEWLESTIKKLESSSKLPHQTILLEYLQNLKNNLFQ